MKNSIIGRDWCILGLALLVISLAGCTGALPEQPVVSTASSPQPTTAQPQPAPAETAAPQAPAAPAPTAGAADPTLASIEVTYFTPAQSEGPYYPPQKPDDRDNDLTVVPGASGMPAGQRLLLQGRVFDRSGQPMPGVLVEIWQTDNQGIYLHPGDANTARRDLNFQFYGEALTAADGSYNFLTIIPGEYEPRPRHIHVKVKLDGRELLTTQFYFPDDLSTAADGIFSSAGDAASALLVALQEGSDDRGNLLVGTRDVILDINP